MKEVDARHLLSCPPNGDFNEAVREVVRGTRQDGWPSIRRVAKLTGSSVRTIQRRLAAEETDFSELVDQVREELAVEMLGSTDAPLAQIARETGYSNVASFIRAFKRWTGKTPAEFRH